MKKILIAFIPALLLSCQSGAQNKEHRSSSGEEEIRYAVEMSDAEWKAKLTDMEYQVMRKAATERAFSSDLLDIKDEGVYVCAACGNPLFRSEHKFDSGSGWPSFDREIEGNVAYSVDHKIGVARTEEHCARCGGHLGHVFDDGPPQTTGKRHCINGVALDFISIEEFNRVNNNE
ncbi:peptide-methionine (R)-S-oxide reductase MsrB [Robertkochia sediminum]|uniref:peptide-methionine (R)-S-oxide reductase MsrB n=1 Tax=Robertkochia sediminum TaxID=2785326 RepID=UPI001934B637|nr:peptide-methionine (R)-S-oxide reductase MsrB [Robertkochia sediminum]MBL7473626.1 peptide-methionine (R)-S-oxide reductase MsrB [Robertkochia sediminum]